MDVKRKTINTLFINPIQYEIPIYQRRYVWDISNWEPLWNNIKDNFEGKLDGHFTGAIVTRDIPEANGRGSIEKYEIIDGQQRLTTFQIILCAFKNLVESEGYTDTAELVARIEKHIRNPKNAVNADDREIRGDLDRERRQVKKSVYKLLPTEYDSETFRTLVKLEKGDTLEDIKPEEGNNIRHAIEAAYCYFRNRIKDYVNGNYQTMHNLLTSFIGGFEVAQIKLDLTDRSQEIFLSINATGRQLSEFDYLRNYIFLRTTEKEECDRLYNDHWHNFETDPWTTEKLNNFFLIFLITKLGARKVFRDNAKLFDLYEKEYLQKLPNQKQKPEDEIDQLEIYAETYKELDDPNTRTGSYMQFHKDLGIGGKGDGHYSKAESQHNRNIACIQALILHLKNELEVEDEDLYMVFEIIESYVARYFLVEPLDYSYAYETIEIYLDELVNGRPEFTREFSVDNLIEFLDRKNNKRRWQTNDKVSEQFERGKFREKSGPRFKESLWFSESYILYRVENWKRNEKGEDPLNFDFKDFRSTFTFREWMLNTTKLSGNAWRSPGNFTLCTNPTRPKINSFEQEKTFLETPENSVLLLNREICAHKKWENEDVYKREEDLLSCFYKIWKPANEFRKRTSKATKTSLMSSIKLTSPKWISMIQSDAYQPTRFETSDGIIVLSKIRVTEQNQVKGSNNENNEYLLNKQDILFGCSANDWGNLLYDTSTRVSRQNSEVVKPLQLNDLILELVQRNKFSVKAITRLGREFPSKIEDFDDDAIYLKIKDREVIVFRSGLIEFLIEGLESTVKRWGIDDLYGYIEFYDFLGELSQDDGLPQEIKVESRSLDPNLVPRKLQPNMKVKFNLQIIQKGEYSYFQASDVAPVTTRQSYQGKVKFFYPEKGSGFLTSSDYRDDIYLHKSQVRSKDLNLLQDGHPVEFNIAETVEGQSSVAINVKVKRT